MAEQHLLSRINEVRDTGKPLVVLLKGSGSESAMVETIIRTTGLSALREQTTLFVLSTSGSEAATLKPIQTALSMAGQPPVGTTDLPVVLLIDGTGKAIKVLRGLVTAGELQQCLLNGVAKFSSSKLPESQHLTAGSQTEGRDPLSAGAATPQQPSSSTPQPPASSSAATSVDPGPPSAAAATFPLRSDTQQEPAALTLQEAHPDPDAPLHLQIYLADGQAIRIVHKGSALLRDVCSTIEEHIFESISSGFKLVSLHLGREFSQQDMSKSLSELGIPSMTSLRLHKVQQSGGHSSAMSGFLAPLKRLALQLQQLLQAIIGQLFGLGRQRSSGTKDPSGQDNESQDQYQASAYKGNTQQTATGQSLRRRAVQQGRVHGIHDAPGDEDQDSDGNSYWNGNSTQFDADD